MVLLWATTAALGDQAAVGVSPGRVEVLRSVGTLAPDVVGLFREPIGFKQTAIGDYYIFDRRAHAVYSVDASGRTSRKLVQIGAEDGRVIEPSAFDVAINGSFAVADSPNGRERVQLFDSAGVRTGGFLLPGRGAARVVLGSLSLNGVGELPLVAPTVRTAAVDGLGRLWVSFVIPFTYVYDADGEKLRTVQFRGAGLVAPSSLSFTSRGRLLITPGCYEFAPR